MATIKDVFNRIAPSWYNYRHHTIFRTELEGLAGRWSRGRLLNAGCGHGADFLPFREGHRLTGVDISQGMLGQAQRFSRKYGFSADLLLSDVRYLPFTDSSFDWAVAVATYHHIAGKQDRLTALAELHRVLKPGGEAFITAWNRWQRRFWLSRGDVMVPWRSRDETFYRYYHLFSYREMRKLAERAGFTVLESFPESGYRLPVKYFSRNICLLVRKEQP